MSEKLIEFVRKRDYVLVKELGHGACGKTVLLRDDTIDEHFVCKKYAPLYDEHREELFDNFVREIKLLHLLYHQHVVRVFNYYLYPDQLTGYILMEYVEGQDVEEYLQRVPERTNEVFRQTIDGFRHMEVNRILHRDIRPQNIMVRDDGTVKIIDLGFGKQIQQPPDFDKSISLNWWCEPPVEFENSFYDFRTEVYFVGKLFEKIILEHGIDHFKYDGILRGMCHRTPASRTPSFFDIQKEIESDRFEETEFTEEELEWYRDFAILMEDHVTQIENGTKYVDDLDRIMADLEDAYRKVMLEMTVPNAALILRCFLNGSYYYRRSGFSVSAVKNFRRLLKSCTREKQRIVMANLHTRLDSITRYAVPEDEDDIPF